MSVPAPDDTMEAGGHGGAGPSAVPLLAAGAAPTVALGYTMTTAKHELNESEAKLEKAEAKLEKAKTELEKAKTELENAKTELEKAKTELEKAKTELEKAKGTDDEESAKTYYAAVLEGVTTAQRGVTTAQRGVDTAQRGVDTAQTVVAAATDQVLAAQKCGGGSAGPAAPGTLFMDAKEWLEEKVPLVTTVDAALDLLSQFLNFVRPHKHIGAYDMSSMRKIPRTAQDWCALSQQSVSEADTDRFDDDKPEDEDGGAASVDLERFAPAGRRDVDITMGRPQVTLMRRSERLAEAAGAREAAAGAPAVCADSSDNLKQLQTPSSRYSSELRIGSVDLQTRAPERVRQRVRPGPKKRPVNVTTMEKELFGDDQFCSGVTPETHTVKTDWHGCKAVAEMELSGTVCKLCTEINNTFEMLLQHYYNERHETIFEKDLEPLVRVFLQLLSNALKMGTHYISISKKSKSMSKVPLLWVVTGDPVKEGLPHIVAGEGDVVGVHQLQGGDVVDSAVEVKVDVVGSNPMAQCAFQTLHFNGRQCSPPEDHIDKIERESAYLCSGVVTNGVVAVVLTPLGYDIDDATGVAGSTNKHGKPQFLFFVETSGTTKEDGAFHFLAKQMMRTHALRDSIEKLGKSSPPKPRPFSPGDGGDSEDADQQLTPRSPRSPAPGSPRTHGRAEQPDQPVNKGGEVDAIEFTPEHYATADTPGCLTLRVTGDMRMRVSRRPPQPNIYGWAAELE